MKILWYNWKDIKNPTAGGAEVFTYEIAKRLANKGHEVTLFTSTFDGGKEVEVIDDINVVRRGTKFNVYAKARAYYVNNANNFDLVVDEINTRPFFTPRFARGKKIIALIHQLAREFWFYETSPFIALMGYCFLEKLWLKNYIGIPTVTVSESTKKDLIKLGFKNIFLIPNGLNALPLNGVPKKDVRPTIAYVGRMTKAKKPQDVITAFKYVKMYIPNVQLWMIGEGYLKGKLLRSAVSDIHFFGHLTNDKRDELVKRAWVLAVPGVREGWGMVVTDSNALGTPAVGYRINGLIDSIQDGYNGLLVAPNPASLAKGLINILSNLSLQKNLSNNALEWARRFSWDKSAERFNEIVKAVSNGSR